jgi:hypothetical protein
LLRCFVVSAGVVNVAVVVVEVVDVVVVVFVAAFDVG